MQAGVGYATESVVGNSKETEAALPLEPRKGNQVSGILRFWFDQGRAVGFTVVFLQQAPLPLPSALNSGREVRTRHLGVMAARNSE